MPVLDAECDLLPETLFDQDPPAGDGVWWLAHTRPRQEKALARDMVVAGLSFYLPCTPHRIRVRKRIVTSRIPLFSGYVFIHVNEDDRMRVFAGGRVARITPVRDQVLLWNDLRNVRRVLDLGQPVEPADCLTAGTTVSIRTGPLAGMTGTIVRSAGGTRFIVRVDLIQRGISVVVDAKTLGKLG